MIPKISESLSYLIQFNRVFSLSTAKAHHSLGSIALGAAPAMDNAKEKE